MAAGLSVVMPQYKTANKRIAANKKMLQDHKVELKLSFNKRGVVISMRADELDWYEGAFVSWTGKFDKTLLVKSMLVPVKIRKK